MAGNNGGVIGVANVPSLTVASGCWRPSFIAQQLNGELSGKVTMWPTLADASFASVTGLWHCQEMTNAGAGGILDSSSAANHLVFGQPINNIGGLIAPPLPLFNSRALLIHDATHAGVWGAKLGTGFAFGTGDFAIEWFMYMLSFGTLGIPMDFRGVNGTSLGPITNVTTGGALVFSKDGNTTDITSAGSAISLNAWMYAAFARVSGTTRGYLGLATASTAAQIGSNFTDGNNYPASGTGQITVGATIGVTLPLLGWMSEIRVTKGDGRGYTGSTIPVPKLPFPGY